MHDALRHRASGPFLAIASSVAAMFAFASCTTEADLAARPPGTTSTTKGDGGGASSSSSGASGSSSGASGSSSGGTPSGDGGTSPANDGGGSSSGGTSPSNGETKTGCKYQPHKTGLTALQQAGGLSFSVYAPSSYDPKVGHGVVVIMHGQDSNGTGELNAFWKPIADEKSLVLIAAKGSRPSTTGDPAGANWGVADLNNVLDIMTDVDDCYNVFTKKHLLWGFSEGGFYGYTLGLGAAERFSGLAMGGANTSFAQQNGFAPASAAWKIPVSDVHGAADFNPIAFTYQDRDAFLAAGHVFTLHEHPGGHSISAEQVRSQYDDLSSSVAP